MKRSFFDRISLVRFLISSYILLLVFVIFFRYNEFQQAKAAALKINSIAKSANFVDNESKNEIAQVSEYMLAISRRRELSSYIVIFLLFILAFSIGNAIRLIKRTTAELIRSKENYEKFVQHTEELITRWDSQGKLLFANRAFKEKMNYSDEELPQLNVCAFFSEESNPMNDVKLAFYNHEEQIKSINFSSKTKDGEDIYLEGNIVFNYRHGKLETAEAFLRDITQKKRLHDELSSSENKYKVLFDLSPLPKYFIDTETLEFVEVNPAAVKKYGYNRKEFLNLNISDLQRQGENEKKLFHDWLTPYRIIGSSFETKTRHFKKDGQAIEVELRYKTIELMNRKMFLVVAIDVTKKERLERQMNQAIIKAQENERKEIGIELHDNICQVLASSRLLLDAAKRVENPESHRLIDLGRKHISEALTEIRNLSHQMAPTFFDVCSLVEAIRDLMANMNPENKFDVQLDLDDESSLEAISRDIQLNLYRILQEQLRNIIKYSEATKILVELNRHQHFIRLRITDNGIGFDRSKVKKGIGLINMQRRAELFSGTFSIRSAQGKGTCVFVELPVSDGDPAKNLKNNKGI